MEEGMGGMTHDLKPVANLALWTPTALGVFNARARLHPLHSWREHGGTIPHRIGVASTTSHHVR